MTMTDPVNIGDWRGKDVYLTGEQKLGKLDDVYYDAETDEPVFLCVKTGRLSHKQVVVPVHDVTASPDRLTVPWGKADADGAPTTRPGEELSVEDEERAYRHYGMNYQPPATPSGRRLVRR